MERLIMQDLIRWKEKRDRKPLLMTGVRQSGKTYILQRFGQEHFESVAYLNLEKQPQVGEVFERDYDVRRIVRELSNLFLKEAIDIQKTLLILDEIQIQPKAITALKYFQEDLPDLAVVGAGSLLGVSLRRDQAAFPVGKIDRIILYPMNFEEFLKAHPERPLTDIVKNYPLDEALPDYILEELEAQLRTYLIVGGMPEAVKVWYASQDLHQVQEIQDNLLFGYENDFSKYALPEQIVNIRDVWRSVPVQLAQDNNKFIFSRVRDSARAKTLEAAMGWLVDAGLIYRLSRVNHASAPLSSHALLNQYKVYLADVGLLSRRGNFSMTALVEKSSHTGNFRGSLIENYVLNELLVKGFDPYYWTSGNLAELDFIVENHSKVIPIEAKANINTQAKSYRQFVKKYDSEIGFKFSLKNIGVNKVESCETYSLPLAYVWRLREYLQTS